MGQQCGLISVAKANDDPIINIVIEICLEISSFSLVLVIRAQLV